AAEAGRPKPAVSESPSATIRSGPSAPAAGKAGPHSPTPPNRAAASATAPASTWTQARRLPYERGASGSAPGDGGAGTPSRRDTKDLTTDSIQDTSMHDISGSRESGLR